MGETRETPTGGLPATDGSVILHLQRFFAGGIPVSLQEAETLARELQKQWPEAKEISSLAHKLLVLREVIVDSKPDLPPKDVYESLADSLDTITRVPEDSIKRYLEKILTGANADYPTRYACSPQDLIAWTRGINDRLESARQNLESVKSLTDWLEGIRYCHSWPEMPVEDMFGMIDKADQAIHALCLELDTSIYELQTQIDINKTIMDKSVIGSPLVDRRRGRQGYCPILGALLFLAVLVPMWACS